MRAVRFRHTSEQPGSMEIGAVCVKCGSPYGLKTVAPGVFVCDDQTKCKECAC